MHALTRRGIACVWARDSHGKDHLFDGEPSVKLVSMHSSKGLEFERVFIPALDAMPGKNEDEAAEAELLYVAMTRATERLTMSCGGEDGFAGRVGEAVEALCEAARVA